VCNVIMHLVRMKLDLTHDYIIDHIGDIYCISITYSMTWNTRTEALTEIFGDWKLTYVTLPQYQA